MARTPKFLADFLDKLTWWQQLLLLAIVVVASLFVASPRERRQRAEAQKNIEALKQQQRELAELDSRAKASLLEASKAAAKIRFNFAIVQVVLTDKNPGVAKSTFVLPDDPCIYHVLDWHYVTREALGKAEGLEGDRLETRYVSVLRAVSDVHAAQLLILADVPEVFVEGMTELNEPIVATEIRALQNTHQDVTALYPDDGDAAGLLLADHRQRLLRLGAAAELQLEGKNIKLLAAESHEAYEAARGKPLDDPAHAKREQSIVDRIVKRGESAFLVLGGDHDLTEAIKAHPGWGYVRITPKGYPE